MLTVMQLLSQIIKLSYFPQIKVKHTSKIFHGQIYIPWVNWLLMLGTICVAAALSNVSYCKTISIASLFVLIYLIRRQPSSEKPTVSASS